MSQENVDLVLQGFARFERGEITGEVFASDATLTGPEGWPEQGPFHGRETIRRQFERLSSDWSSQEFTDVEVVAADRDWVVLAFTWTTRGAASGVESHFRMAAAYRVRENEFAEAHFRWDRADALEAAGLSE